MYGRRFGAKYGNTKVEVDGMPFDSKREAARWRELRMLERAGEISDLRRQVRYELVPKLPGERPVDYIADFVYRDKNGNEVVLHNTLALKKRVYEASDWDSFRNAVNAHKAYGEYVIVKK